MVFNSSLPFQINFEKMDAFFFDFDGVLVDSTELKTKAYQEIFHPFGTEAVEIITDYHLENGGVDRYRKIKYVLERIQVNASLTNTLAEQFASLVKEKVKAAPAIPGIIELVRGLNEKRIPLYVVSGTPEKELQEIVIAKKWDSYFVKVEGSPRLKSEIVKTILEEKGYNPLRCIFVGDAVTDYKTAIESNFWYLGVPRL